MLSIRFAGRLKGVSPQDDARRARSLAARSLEGLCRRHMTDAARPKAGQSCSATRLEAAVAGQTRAASSYAYAGTRAEPEGTSRPIQGPRSDRASMAASRPSWRRSRRKSAVLVISRGAAASSRRGRVSGSACASSFVSFFSICAPCSLVFSNGPCRSLGVRAQTRLRQTSPPRCRAENARTAEPSARDSRTRSTTTAATTRSQAPSQLLRRAENASYPCPRLRLQTPNAHALLPNPRPSRPAPPNSRVPVGRNGHLCRRRLPPARG